MAKKKKRKNYGQLIIILLMSISIVGLLLFIGIGDYFSGSINMKGNFTRKIDITDEVVSRVGLYLHDVQGINVDTDYVKSYVDKVEVEADLSFEKAGMGKGTITSSINELSYQQAEEKVYHAVSDQMTDFIIERLKRMDYDMAGISVEELAIETLGMPIYDYLKKCEIDLMPGIEVLNDEYGLGGEYRLKNDSLTVQNGTIQMEIPYVIKKGNLWLDVDGQMVKYLRKEAK